MSRVDGVRIKHGDPMYTVVPHIMTERSDSMNMIELFIPIKPMNLYIKEKREQGIEISHLALILAAFTRTVAEFPSLNRFIVNRKIYARKGIQIGMVVLKPEGETMNKFYLDPADDIFTVNQKLLDYVTENRKQAAENPTDKIISFLVGVPGVLRAGVALIKWADKHGLLPQAVVDMSPMHESMVITNLASIGTNHIFHHIYNFGTVSEIVAMGNLRNMPKKGIGATGFERCLPMGVVMDERIASGVYFSRAFRKLENYLKDPHLLEGPPEVCIREWEQKGL
ncbi:MAG: hypothetical protein HUJ69_06400 [Lachnospiraceae bacterium]|nr:hypothetical protein [Lachnospiraceae bacterium]